jgi:hypothetical protein
VLRDDGGEDVREGIGEDLELSALAGSDSLHSGRFRSWQSSPEGSRCGGVLISPRRIFDPRAPVGRRLGQCCHGPGALKTSDARLSLCVARGPSGRAGGRRS